MALTTYEVRADDTSWVEDDGRKYKGALTVGANSGGIYIRVAAWPKGARWTEREEDALAFFHPDTFRQLLDALKASIRDYEDDQ